MSIVSVTQQTRADRSSTAGAIEETLQWVVKSNSATEPMANVETASGVPVYGQVHPTQSYLYVTGKNVQRTDDPKTFVVTATYSTRGAWGGGQNTPPLDLTPRIRWYGIKSVESVDCQVSENASINGKKIQNSALQDFNPPLTAERTRQGCQITRYVSAPNIPNYNAYFDAVNSDVWRGFLPGTVRVDDIVCEEEHIQQYVVYKETWTFVIQFGPNDESGVPTGHRLRVPDKGKYEFHAEYIPQDDETEAAKWFPIIGNDGNQVTEDVDLNGSGRINTPGADTKWLYFQVYKKLPFAGFVPG